jgi:hypothetical protein
MLCLMTLTYNLNNFTQSSYFAFILARIPFYRVDFRKKRLMFALIKVNMKSEYLLYTLKTFLYRFWPSVNVQERAHYGQSMVAVWRR